MELAGSITTKDGRRLPFMAVSKTPTGAAENAGKAIGKKGIC